MEILSILLTVILIAVSVLIVLIVLIQRPKQEGLGAAFGGSTLDSALGAHTTDVLQKITTYLGIIFFVCSIALAMLKTREFRASAASNVLEKVEERELVAPEIPPSISDLPINLDSMPETETEIPGTGFDLKGSDSPAEPAQKGADETGEKSKSDEKPAEPAEKETPDSPKEETPAKGKETPKEPAKSVDGSGKKDDAKKSAEKKEADSKGESGN